MNTRTNIQNTTHTHIPYDPPGKSSCLNPVYKSAVFASNSDCSSLSALCAAIFPVAYMFRMVSVATKRSCGRRVRALSNIVVYSVFGDVARAEGF